VRGALLRMITPAAIDGRTGFIDGAAAWERLDPAMQSRIDGLEVVYHFTGAQEQNRFGFPRDLRVVERNPKADAALAGYRREFPPVVHPLVITQHETGRKVLKLSPMHAQRILGMEPQASDQLLTELADRAGRSAPCVLPYLAGRRCHPVGQLARGPQRHRRAARRRPLAQRTTIVGDYHLGRYLDPADKPAQPPRRLDD
jgi:taurine dioxygenase